MLVAETHNITWINTIKLDSWSSGNAFVSGTGSLRFKSRAGQNRLSVANVLQQKLCCPGAMMRIRVPQTRYTLRRNTASIKKKLDGSITEISANVKAEIESGKIWLEAEAFGKNELETEAASTSLFINVKEYSGTESCTN